MLLAEAEESKAAKVPRGDLGRAGCAEPGGEHTHGDHDRGGTHQPVIICGDGYWRGEEGTDMRYRIQHQKQRSLPARSSVGWLGVVLVNCGTGADCDPRLVG